VLFCGGGGLGGNNEQSELFKDVYLAHASCSCGEICDGPFRILYKFSFWKRNNVIKSLIVKLFSREDTIEEFYLLGYNAV
jgi:hypothetical protein